MLKKCSRSDLHRHLAGFKSAASALGYGSLVEMERAPGLPPGKSGFASRRLDDFGIARILKWKRRGAPVRRSSQDPMLVITYGLHLKIDRATEAKVRKPEVMLPIPRSGTICFRDSPGALVRFSFHE